MEINIDLFKKSSDFNECLLKDTEACRQMNNPQCPQCELGKAGEDTQKRALEDFEVVKALLPPEGISHLAKSDVCVFCKDEPKRKRDYYAISDFAHKEPQRTKSSVIGIKVKTRVGSMIPVQMACCSRCRRNFLMRDYLNWIIIAAFAVVVLALLYIIPLREALVNVNELLPLGIFVGALAVGYIVGNVVRAAFTNSRGKVTEFEVSEQPTIKKMFDLGWFSLFSDKRSTRLIFSKKRLERGWFSGDHVET